MEVEVAPGPAALPPPPPSARERANIGFGWTMAFPTGDLHDFIGKPAYRGFDFVALWPIFRSFYIGGAFGYNLLHEDRDHETYQLDTGAVTAKLYNTANFWMSSVVARYAFLTPESLFRPYLGIRAGLAAISTSVMVADFSFNDNPVGFLLAPEGGVTIRFTDFLLGSVSYQYNFTTADSGRFKNLSYGALQFGLVMRVGS